ncbi:alpha/beta fold hydrolase [Geomesophilobacter sediminis]|uniref:Alpha/beta hydrolase n=1 Tax=Geomesophilobacter sediminis TaxID=2798584 RepID=A0A8J7JCE5_9BACT|nr:alpha/beta hydrolase [Geomesophilobacter sediminis]MBJ6724463.1 alpha/beta hydrolase [Geomesophilobacter sediminis]
MHRSVLPLVRQTLGKHPAMMGVASAATGFMRQMSIKPFTPANRRREFQLKDRVESLHACRTQIFKEKGVGELPTIVVGGFVPDATEQVEFQRPLFREYGSVYYLNYPRHGFSLEMFFAQLADLIEYLNARRQRPVLFGVSFGCGLIAQFLKESANDPNLKIRGVALASPVLCTADLIRPEGEKAGGVRMLESNLKRILKSAAEGSEGVERQIERARRCFQALFETGAANRALTGRHLSIRKKIMHVIETTPADGGYQRVLALQQLDGPRDGEAVFTGPTLALLAEAEDNLLVPTSPTLSLLRDPERRRHLFPRLSFWKVTSPEPDDAVAHASLIFHHHCYNPLIRSWYHKLQAPQLFAVI